MEKIDIYNLTTILGAIFIIAILIFMRFAKIKK